MFDDDEWECQKLLAPLQNDALDPDVFAPSALPADLSRAIAMVCLLVHGLFLAISAKNKLAMNKNVKRATFREKARKITGERRFSQRCTASDMVAHQVMRHDRTPQRTRTRRREHHDCCWKGDEILRLEWRSYVRHHEGEKNTMRGDESLRLVLDVAKVSSFC